MLLRNSPHLHGIHKTLHDEDEGLWGKGWRKMAGLTKLMRKKYANTVKMDMQIFPLGNYLLKGIVYNRKLVEGIILYISKYREKLKLILGC